MKKIPINHLAIIMDGNRRWATERGLPKIMGHTEGAKTLKTIAHAVRDRGIRYLTVWALSTDNLKKRSPKELQHLFSLFDTLTDYLGDFFDNNVRCNIIGDITKLPSDTQIALSRLIEKTTASTGMTLTLAVNYGGRDELLRGMKKYTEALGCRSLHEGEGLRGSFMEFSEDIFEKHLDTHDLPDPDLIIRTGGQKRLSGFLPWQSVYSELYFTKTLWPAFTEDELDAVIAWYHGQQQNKGK